MKYFVTGGAGFIGSHVCEELIRRGNSVICFDNLLTGKRENIAHLINGGRFRFVLGDVTDSEAVLSHLKGCDAVFNIMASKKSVCEVNPVKDCDINAAGTLNLLLCMNRLGIKKIVHSSTGSVYGECPAEIHEYSQLNPVSYYGVSKLAGEKYVAAFGDLHDFEYTILRYFHVYGERQDGSAYGGVVPIFIRQALAGDSLTVHGDGEQMRSFTYVGDVVHATVKGLEAENMVYNCASGFRITINDLVGLIQKYIAPTGVVYQPPLLGDVKNFKINNQLICNDFNMGFTNFEDGLIKTIKHYASLRHY
jgi:UDP-glucose 4-epimerase